MAATKNHDYHLVDPDPVADHRRDLRRSPCSAGWSCGSTTIRYGRSCSRSACSACWSPCISWWAETIREAHGGDHTPVVQLHLRYGMILFIASEVMFFLAWFWAFFDSAHCSPATNLNENAT